MAFPTQQYVQSGNFGMHGGVPQVLGPGGMPQQLGPGGMPQQVGPGGAQQVLGPGGTQQLLGPGGMPLVAPSGPSGATGQGAWCCGGPSDEAAGTMGYVGSGGSYAIETTYRYVGNGAGEFDLQTPRRNRMPMLVCGGVLVLLLVAAVLLFLGPDLYTTTKRSRRSSWLNRNSCVLWGDPHVQTFDGKVTAYYGEGEFWVMKSSLVHVQARYLATPFTKGLAATKEVVIGGPFMEGHKFKVGPMENGGQITCDDVPILTEFPSVGRCGPLLLGHDGVGRLVDSDASGPEKHVVHIRAQEEDVHFHMQVLRWANHLNVRVTAEPGTIQNVDGVCGNFNQNLEDDSLAEVRSRMGSRIGDAELLFNERTEGGNVHRVTLADCETSKRMDAVKQCQEASPGVSTPLLDSCVFDVCFGGPQYGFEDGVALKQADEKFEH